MKAHKRAVSGLSQDERDVLSVVGKRAVDDNTEYSVASRETRFRDPAHANARERGQRMRTEIFGDVAKRYHFDTELSRELLYFFPARHASALTHNFAKNAEWGAERKAREIHCRLRVPAALQEAAVACDETQNVARAREGSRPRLRRSEETDRFLPLPS